MCYTIGLGLDICCDSLAITSDHAADMEIAGFASVLVKRAVGAILCRHLVAHGVARRGDKP